MDSAIYYHRYLMVYPCEPDVTWFAASDGALDRWLAAQAIQPLSLFILCAAYLW